MKSSLLSSTNNYPEYKKVGAFRKLASITSSFFPALSLHLTTHTVTHPFYPEPIFQLQHGCRREDNHYCHTPRQHQRFTLLPSQACRQPLFLLHLQKASEYYTWYRNNKYDQDKCKFSLLNCPTNPQLKGKKLVIPTAALPFETRDSKMVPHGLSKISCTDSKKTQYLASLGLLLFSPLKVKSREKSEGCNNTCGFRDSTSELHLRTHYSHFRLGLQISLLTRNQIFYCLRSPKKPSLLNLGSPNPAVSATIGRNQSSWSRPHKF